MTETLETGRKAPIQAFFLCCLTAAVLGIVLFVHWPALQAKALSFDDDQYLVNNTLVKNPSWTSASRFLGEVTKPSTVGGYYQPLTMISLMLDYAMGGRPDNLYVFHRTSIILHLANTALIIVLLYLLFGDMFIAAAVGLLFGVHPMTVEPIPWIGERKTLLAAFFSLLCLVFYVRYTQKRSRLSFGACLAAYVLALMSKPTAVPLPVLMLFMDYWPLKRLSRRAIVEKVPLFVAAVISGIITYIGQKMVGGATLGGDYGIARSCLVIGHDIVFYLYKIVYPVNLSSHYPFPKPLALSNPMVLAGVIGSCLWIVILAISLRRTRALATGWLFFFVGILPTMQLVRFSNVIASDKFAYLPSLGLLLVLAAFFKWILSFGQYRKSIVYLLAVIIVLAGMESIATRRYLHCWRDTVSLFEHMSTLAPNSEPVHTMLGNALRDEGKLNEAIEQYNRAIELDPNASESHNNIGTILGAQGRLDDAIEHFRRAIEINPGFPPFHHNLGGALFNERRLDEAAEQFRIALLIKPDFAPSHNSLGMVLLVQGKVDEAIVHFRRALEIEPNFPSARKNLEKALALKASSH